VTYKEFLSGRPLVFTSPESKGEVTRRINETTGNRLNFFHHGVIGRVEFEQVKIRWNTPFFMTNFEPVLSGWLRTIEGKTTLTAKHGVSFPANMFIAALYLVVPFMLWAVFFGPRAEEEPILLLISLAQVGFFAFLPHLMHFLFNRNADAHLDSILHLLETEVGLVQVMPDVAASED
jgi:hypothetical protein